MKKIILFITAVLLLCACSNKKEEPTPEPIIDGTEFRLDSIYSYREDTIRNKTIVYYTQSNKYFNSAITYTLNNNQWVPSTKESYVYDSKWNVIEQHSSTYSNGEWRILWSAYFYDIDSKGTPAKDAVIYWDIDGEEISRRETMWEWDYLGNAVLETIEIYSKGTLISYEAIKSENFYTSGLLDSVYTYSKTEPTAPFECSGKTIYLDSISISYLYQDSQFVLQSKSKVEFDSHNNVTLGEYYNWKENNWVPNWYYSVTYKYLYDTDLIEERSVLDIDYDKDGNIRWQKRSKDKYFYTKM